MEEAKLLLKNDNNNNNNDYYYSLSPSVCSTFLSGSLSSFFAFLKTYFFTRGIEHWQRF